MYQQYLDQVIAFAIGEEFAEEAKQARRRYCEMTGEVFEEDEDYEMRMVSFLEWYIFNRPLTAPECGGKTLVALFIDRHFDKLTTPELNTFRSFTRTVHGLFRVRRLGEEEIVLTHLWSGEEYQVHERRAIRGLERADILEARLIPFANDHLFSHAFCFHPREARGLILRHLRKFKKSGEMDELTFINRLAQMRLTYDRVHRYDTARRHDISKIYSFA